MSIGNSTVVGKIVATLIDALDLVTGQAPLIYEKDFNFSNGTGANQANSVFSDQRTLAASATENLDLSGTLTDVFGVTINFAKIKALAIYAAPGNTNDVIVGDAGSDPWLAAFGATGTVTVKPGGLLLLVAPDANGYAVVADTGDLLKIANSGSGTGVTYDVVILGC